MERRYHLTTVHILALATIALLVLSPLIVHADVGIAAIAIDSSIEGKGSFDTNGGINVGDIISTGEKGSLTILFDDESMLTLGPNAKAQIMQYSQTPPPGVSEIKIISGSFCYFPGTILENGGKQVLNNEGGRSTGAATITSGPEIVTNTAVTNLSEDLSELNEQLSDISTQINFNELPTGDLVANELVISNDSLNAADTGGQVPSHNRLSDRSALAKCLV